MTTYEATFRIVTPMFLGDAHQHAQGIRPPSLKGALRFWWRALQWQHLLKRHNSNDEALAYLHHRETLLFGHAAEDDGGGGQGMFMLRALPGTFASYAAKADSFNVGQTSLGYLLGQGLWHFKDKLTRNALRENQTFVVALAFRPTAAQDDIAQILDALKLFGLLGGLGSRSRKGWGSVTLEKLSSSTATPWQAPSTKTAYIEALRAILGTPTNDLPPFSAFSKKTSIAIVAKESDAFDALKKVGNELQKYRSYGRNGTVNGAPSEKNFKDDHDNVLKLATVTPRRAVFGLPHNYFFSSAQQNIEINPVMEREELRRASPLLLHIHRLNDKEYIAVHTLLEAQFLPKDASLKIANKTNKKSITVKEVSIDYGVIHTYLARYANAERILG